MTDTLTVEKRSWNMSRVHSKNTSIELKVRKWLFQNGYRYRVNVKNLPGKPDIVMRPYNTVIFIHGCFWHRHQGCKDATIPKTRTDFWEAKFEKNMLNDKKNQEKLQAMGFRVIVLWECEIEKSFEKTMHCLSGILGQPHHKETI